MLRYIFSAAVKPIRLVGWLGTIALSLIFLNPFIGIGGTIGYILIIAIDVNRREFRALVDREYRIASISYSWRRKAKELVDVVDTVKKLMRKLPKHLKRDAINLEFYLDNALNEGLSMIEYADQIDTIIRIQGGNKKLEKELTMIEKQITSFRAGLEKMSGTAILAFRKPEVSAEEALAPFMNEVKELSSGLKEARLALDEKLRGEKTLEKEFEKLEGGGKDKE